MLCSSWLNAINMPVREQENAVSVARMCQAVTEPADTTGILDSDDEYVIYQDDAANPVETASGMVTSEPSVTFIHGQQPPSLAPVQQKESPAMESPGDAIAQGGHEVVAAAPTISVTLAQQEGVNFPQVVDLAAEEDRLIMELRTTNDRARREELMTEVLKLLHMKDNVVQNGASKSTDDGAPAPTSFIETKKDDWSDGNNGQDENTSSNGTPQVTPRELGTQPSPQTQQPTGRKTPPHLRGLGGRARN